MIKIYSFFVNNSENLENQVFFKKRTNVKVVHFAQTFEKLSSSWPNYHVVEAFPKPKKLHVTIRFLLESISIFNNCPFDFGKQLVVID